MAEGISTALFATLEGIAVSVPAIAFYAYFRNRISRMSLEVAMASETLLDQFALGVRAVHPLANPPARRPSAHRPAAAKRAVTRTFSHAPPTFPRRRPNGPEPHAVAGRGVAAHHVLHDAGPFRLADRRGGGLRPTAHRPAALPSGDLALDRLVVAIDADGALSIGDACQDRKGRRDLVERPGEDPPEGAESLFGDPARNSHAGGHPRRSDVPYGTIRRVLQTAQDAGFVHFSLVVEREERP